MARLTEITPMVASRTPGMTVIAASRGDVLYQKPVISWEKFDWHAATPRKTSQVTTWTAGIHRVRTRQTATAKPISTKPDVTQTGAPKRGLLSSASVSTRTLVSSGGELSWTCATIATR